MVNLNIVLEKEPVNTLDAGFRFRMALRILAEMVLRMVEDERDNKGIPSAEIPLVSDSVPSPAKNTLIINE